MRKLIAMLLVVMLLFSFAGCKQKDVESEQPTQTASDVLDETTSSEEQQKETEQIKTGEDKVIYESEDGNKIIF